MLEVNAVVAHPQQLEQTVVAKCRNAGYAVESLCQTLGVQRIGIGAAAFVEPCYRAFEIRAVVIHQDARLTDAGNGDKLNRFVAGMHRARLQRLLQTRNHLLDVEID